MEIKCQFRSLYCPRVGELYDRIVGINDITVTHLPSTDVEMQYFCDHHYSFMEEAYNFREVAG